MNADQAKNLSIVDFMAHLGYDVQYVERGGTENVYFSPVHNEQTPSFKVNNRKNVWFNFSTGNGAGIIDLAMAILESRGEPSTLKSALAFVRSAFGITDTNHKTIIYKAPKLNSSSFSNQAKFSAGEVSQLQFIKACPIDKKVIFDYLESRGVGRKIASKYLLQIHYKNLKANGREFYGFGMKNLSDGYEIRSASDDNIFKSAINGRDLSLIEGFSKNLTLNIMEGMLSALSVPILAKADRFRYDTLVLHSISSFKRSCAFILEKKYTRLNLFLDNPSGKATTQKYMEWGAENDISVEDQSHLYLPYEDPNDALRFNDIKVIQRFISPMP